MNLTVINGSPRKGNTYTVTHKFLSEMQKTAGAGTGKAMKVIETSLRYWGVNRVYKRGFIMNSITWDKMKISKKEKYEKQIKKHAQKFYNAVTSKKDKAPYLYTRFMFNIAKQLRKKEPDDSADKRYFKKQGWFNGNSPFNSQ